MKILSVVLVVVVSVGCVSPTRHASQSGIPADASGRLSKVWRKPGVTFRDYDYVYVEDVKSLVGRHDRRVGPVDNAALILKSHLVGSMSNCGLRWRVSGSTLPRDPKYKVLRLRCTLESVRQGSQDVRYWIGGGAGTPRMEWRTLFIDAATGDVICEVSKDTRGFGAEAYFMGGSMTDSELLEKGVRRFAQRLSKYVYEVSTKK